MMLPSVKQFIPSFRMLQQSVRHQVLQAIRRVHTSGKLQNARTQDKSNKIKKYRKGPLFPEPSTGISGYIFTYSISLMFISMNSALNW